MSASLAGYTYPSDWKKSGREAVDRHLFFEWMAEQGEHNQFDNLTVIMAFAWKGYLESKRGVVIVNTNEQVADCNTGNVGNPMLYVAQDDLEKLTENLPVLNEIFEPVRKMVAEYMPVSQIVVCLLDEIDGQRGAHGYRFASNYVSPPVAYNLLTTHPGDN